MSRAAPFLLPLRPEPARLLPWLALGAMYAPVLHALLDKGLWSTMEHGHGPIVLAVCLGLMCKRAGERPEAFDARPDPILGWPLLAAGCLLYLFGDVLDVVYAEVGSVIPVMAGLLLLLHGRAALRAMAFPLVFMVFMVPLPGFIVEPVGQAMKILVSASSEVLLRALGYPITRSGVVLQIGPYQLLVADACAGMRTLFMLEALGILYLNLVRHPAWLRNVALALLIVPISFSANVIRVCALALITFHLGDEAGQGFLHGFAGMVLFVSALLMILSFDGLLRKIGAHRALQGGA